jgi:hypothetical protein
MNDPATQSTDFAALYRRAFAEFVAQALWNKLPVRPLRSTAVTRFLAVVAAGKIGQ